MDIRPPDEEPARVPVLAFREVYDLLSPGYRGRCTAPLLVDKKSRKIVSNESSLIVRCFGRLRMEGGTGVDLYPKDLRPEIDRWNDR